MWLTFWGVQVYDHGPQRPAIEVFDSAAISVRPKIFSTRVPVYITRETHESTVPSLLLFLMLVQANASDPLR